MSAAGDDRPKCAGRKTNGEPCGNYPMKGGTVCRKHGGGAPQVRAAAKRRLALAEATAELDRLGRVADVEPAEAMLAMVQEAAANVAVFRLLVQGLRLEVDHELAAVDEDGVPLNATGLGAGLAVRTGSMTKPAEVEVHVWVRMYDAERERLVKWAKACRDAGVDERLVQLAERQVDVVERILAATSAGLLAMTLGVLERELGVVGAELDVVRSVWEVGSVEVIDGALRSAIGEGAA